MIFPPEQAHRQRPTFKGNLLVRRGSRVATFIAIALTNTAEVFGQDSPVRPREAITELTEGIKSKSIRPVTSQKPAPKAITRIKFKGLTAIPEDQALLLMGNRIDHVVHRPPSPSRADDAAYLLQHTLRRHGLPHAQVDWSIPRGQQTILLTVNEGPTRHIGNVYVSGIDAALQQKIGTYFKNEPTGFRLLTKGNIPYIPSLIEQAAENAATHLQSLGYWKASVKLSNTKVDPEQGLVHLYVTVSPGPLFLLAQAELKGFGPINTSLLHHQLSLFNGLPASTQNIKDSRQTALRYFLDQGYAFAEVEMDKTLIGQQFKLIFTIKPGNRYKVGNINITGLERTDPQVMHRRIDKTTGTLYNPELMQANRKKFLSTGAFSSFLIDTHPRNDGYIDLTLRVQEGRARRVGAHIGAGSFEGAIFGLSYLDRNFRGKLQTLAISGEFSGLGLLGQASINDPMLFGTDLNGTLRTFLLTHEFDGYSKLETGIGTELVWTINDSYSLRFYGDAITAKTSSEGLPDSELGYKDYSVARFGISQRLDFRDNPVNPHKGFYGELLTEAGLVTGGSPIPYYKMELRSSYRYPVLESDFLVLSGRAGFISNDDQSDYPIDLRFFLGGPDSVRSFPEREMGPSVKGDPVGGEAYWIASAEYNRKIKGPVYMNIFADAGSLARSTTGIDTADVNCAAGLGFWLNLPIGPIRAEYGYNLNRRDGEPAGTFHFTIGVSF